VLTEEENKTLTQVGPGTPMGDLLRRYWHPIAAVQELEERPTKRVRLLGEDLVLYKDLSGTYGLIELYCAHRLTDLSYGMVEECGIRCWMHGWAYNETGQCIEQPLESEPFFDEIKLKGYRVAIKGGIVWGYLGPEPEPFVPDWEPFSWEDGLVQIVFSLLPCNWLQCQENSMDAVDVELLSLGMTPNKKGQPDQRLALPRIDLQFSFDEIEQGFVYRRTPKTQAEQTIDWSVGQTSLWPNGVFKGDERSCHFEWRVPMDDATTMSVAWFFDRAAPGTKLPPKERVKFWYAPVREEPEREGEQGSLITSHVLNRSFTIWVEQGAIVDRTKEHLVESDRGLMMLRGKLFSQIALIADGGEPKATIRDPDKTRVALPFSQPLPENGAEKADAPSSTAKVSEFPYLAGQPPEVAKTYKKVLSSWRPKRPRATRPHKPS
jgi:5,5'-dehydrodivanillate O-demethylase